MNKKLFIGILLALLLVLVFGFLLKAPQEIIITTDRAEYNLGEELTMTIRNNLASNVCLSSCYPYRLEKNNGEWKSYPYEECKEPDLVESCVEPNQTKGLKLTIPAVASGLHRIAVPSCLDCQIGEKFEENERFYSNEFTIK